MAKKVVIVGGVAGGASTAARLRRLDENCEITMFEKGEYISFANCGLPYYIGNVITERNNLIVQTIESMTERFNINIKNFSEVVAINRYKKTVTVKKVKTGETYDVDYDVLVLSPGAKPIVPPIEGIYNAKNLFAIRNIPDTDMIKAFISKRKPSNAVIVGGGFIGLEMAENLRRLGINVTIVEMSNQVMSPLDFEMAQIVHRHLIGHGINLILEDGVKAFVNNGNKVILSSGKEINTDMVILSIGVAPESKIAVDAGLKVNSRNAIVVNEYMRTSDENIYALGDAVETTDYISKVPTMIPLAWPANRQGRIVADNISGRNVKYPGTLGTSVARVFDITVSTTGNNEKSLKKSGVSYQAIHIHPSSHASYYPGASIISLKLLFCPKTGNIFGAQAVGIDGVEKRIDVIATAIKGNLTVFDLQNLELSYAPPYSSAKDPVNMAGYVASNIIDGLCETFQYYETDDLVKNGQLLVDVRTEYEYHSSPIKGAINIPLDSLRDSLNKLPKDRTIYVHCRVGLRGYLACRILAQYGFKCKNLDGGYITYSMAKYKVNI
jgi:CoA-disulfide reductase